MTSNYFRRVGAARPSHLMYTAGVGALIDLPNFSVLVKGLESWSHAGLADYVVDEPRLRTAVNRSLQLYGTSQITELRSAPWMEGADSSPKDRAAQSVGVPVTPFPQWLRCTACNLLAPIDSQAFTFVNNNPRTPHEARFVHDCRPRGPLAVAARFTLVCTAGHLDEFPYAPFVHHGNECVKAPRPLLRMKDHGGNQAANVTLECVACGERRNIRDAMGERGRGNLPGCRGRHPHLGTYAPDCREEATLMVAGASNQWFPVTLSALALPPSRNANLAELVEERWAELQTVTSRVVFDAFAGTPSYAYLKDYDAEALIAAVQAHRERLEGNTAPAADAVPADLLSPEWEVLSSSPLPDATDDFALEEVGVPDALTGLFADVRQVQRLREARALIGFTRLDAPDPEAPGIATPVDLYRTSPNWVPASEVRGEGIFLRVRQDLLARWEDRMHTSPAMQAHREAYARFRTNRKSDRLRGEFDPMRGWPGERYIALHTLSHLLIRTIALECGYSSASLGERIYAGDGEDAGHPRTGILLYTAVPDSEGTLGGLVSLAEEPHFERIVRRALRDAARCSSDPLCAERLPRDPADYLHGAACHVCLFVSETTCERGNRYLDRRFLVPLADESDQVLTPVGLRP